ncbi:GNAT family N-acetyltransferase [Streptomyces turgidiscabies]|uniref:Acetyltransferase, GNAT family n=2 Tax=Streptomyces TaxID=1883 RepID=L7FET4_STRT8|nr:MULTISPECIES: GNAT family N-acetyltransferase [Streptomyces]ELP69832.1 acetyltransferase, GNAT family [Streptomyces turgidiscabies Car8]MDX3496798.1 GNAT family N-acetyltransferase [Streptomyces turgidiscabies]GAQ74096.1 aminoglycoside 2'-N-acetyltransferase [Streptomyces turgidiscabies]
MAPLLRTAHTADLTPVELAAVRALLDAAFDDGFDEEDWEHALGGLHVLAHDGTGLLAHGSVVMRRALHRGRWLRVGYVEAVAVRADARRRGLGGQVMGALERYVDGGYDLGALSASADGSALYAARGWQLWPGRISALGPAGVVHLPEGEGGVFVRPADPGSLDPSEGLVFDWRDGDVL